MKELKKNIGIFRIRIHHIQKEILLLSIILIALQGLSATEKTTVNISLYDDAGFYVLDDNYLPTGGYAYSLQAALNRYLRWNVAYTYGNWQECLDNVKSGRTDLLFGVFKTPEREKDYCFSTEPIALVSNYICGRSDEEFINDDFTKLSGKKFGLIKGATSSHDIQKLLAEKNITCEYIEGSSPNEMRKLLQNGDIDYYVNNTTVLNHNEKIVQTLSVAPMYVLATKNKQYLMDQFDQAIQTIRKVNPHLTETLLSKIYENKSVNLSSLITQEERNFIKTAQPLKCGVLLNDSPFYATNKDGNEEGIIYEIINQIEQNTGLTIQLIPFHNEDEEIQALKDKTINMIGKVADNYVETQKYDLNLSIPYISSEIIIIKNKYTSNKENTNLCAIQKKHFGCKENYQLNMPNTTFITYDTEQECINALNKGEVGSAIIDNFTTLMNEGSLKDTENIISFIANGMYIKHCFAYADSIDIKYLEVIDKAITVIDTTNIKLSVISDSYGINQENLLYLFIAKYKFQLVLIIAFLTILYILLYFTNSQREKENIKLIEANKKAEKATAAKSEFLSNMSHELRTPLNAIIGLTSLLKETVDDQKTVEDYTEKIDQSSKILLSLINDVLDMSAIESGKLKLDHSAFNIKNSIYSITNIYYEICKNKGIEYQACTSNIEKEILIGDSYRIRQILINLISNAVKFTDQGGSVTISITEKERDETSTFVIFQIADTGCGMSKELKNRLFGKFEQEDATTVRKHGGSGLGLSICKQLVDLMEGTIDVESEINKGTTFTVTIPVQNGNNPQLQATKPMTDLKALIIDSDTKTCNYLASLLTQWNIVHEVSYTTDQAFSLIKEGNKEFNLFFIDLHLYNKDSHLLKEAIQHLRIDKNHLVILGYDSTEKQKENKSSSLFMRKPLFPSELFKTMMNIVGEDGKNDNKDKQNKEISLSGLQVLLVEDNEMNQLIARKILEQKGATISIAKNGKDAVSLIQDTSTRYDVILMDIQMPEMDGYEATRIIRNMDSAYTKNLPIFAMTANSFQSDIVKAQEFGMDGHISKPIDPKILFATLLRIKKEK